MFSIQGQILDFCVLAIVAEKDVYGYELTQTLSQGIELSESTLYPVLRRLLKNDLLESYDQAYDGRNRRYYRMTSLGREVLSDYQKKWKKYVKQVEHFVKEKGEKVI